MYRTMTDAIAYDHIAAMQREAATLRLARADGSDHAPFALARAGSVFRSVASALPLIRRAVVRA